MTTATNIAFFQRGLWLEAYSNIADAIRTLGHDWSRENITWCDLRTCTAPDIGQLDWHSMPFVADYGVKVGPGFVSSGPSSVPMPDRDATPFQIADFEDADVFLVTFRGGDLDRACLKIRDYFRLVGYSPKRLIAVAGGRDTSAHVVLPWAEVERRSEQLALTVRFRQLYNINFRGILLNTLREGIRLHTSSQTWMPEDRRESYLLDSVFTPEFIQMLYMMRQIEPVPHQSHARMNTTIWQAMVDGGLSWQRRADRIAAVKKSLDHTQGVWFPETEPLLSWIGTGRLPPLVEQSSSQFPSHFVHATQLCEFFDMITDGSDERDYNLTPFGNWFLDLLPSKAKDLDAPIRWHSITEQNKPNADAWLIDHFSRIKRAVNKRFV